MFDAPNVLAIIEANDYHIFLTLKVKHYKDRTSFLDFLKMSQIAKIYNILP